MEQQRFETRPMQVGAEVLGLRPGDEKDPGIREALYAAWLKHGVLLFRNIATTEQHLELSRVFGELELHPLEYMRAKHEPLLMELGGDGKRGGAFVYDEAEMRLGRLPWHRDTAYTPDICKGAVLRMLAVPSSDGETMFADTAMAYDDLPEAVKAKLDGLEYTTSLHPIAAGWGAFWKTMRPATNEEDPAGIGKDLGVQRSGPVVVHPALMVHPESGRKCVFLSPKDMLHVVGMAPHESHEFLTYLADHITHPRYVYEHSWKPDDAILWDNRRILHAARGYKVGQQRWAVRTTLTGAIRTGRYLDSNVVPEEMPYIAD